MKLAGPIPGENYTSDTKNYPWHRPPEITDLDKAIDASAKQLLSEEGLPGVVTMLQSGMNIATLTDIFVTSGIGAGKWTPDFALLIAGPVSHIIYLIAKGYEIDADLGIELPKPTITAAFFEQANMDKKKVDTVLSTMDDPEVKAHVQKAVSGFMGMGGMSRPPEAQENEPAQTPQQEQGEIE